MENINSKQAGYPFLDEERVKNYFSDLNIKLLSGRHIQTEEYQLFTLLSDYFDELEAYYANLYRLRLVREIFDNATYFYLDFFDGGHGQLSDPSRYKILTEWQTVVGLMLLDLYYARYFDDPKEIRWSEIKQEIETGDKKERLQLLFFGTLRSGFTPTEWGDVEKKWRTTIASFHELGWVNKLSGQNDPIRFEIKPAIHRLASLYTKELEGFDEFIHLFKTAIEQ